MSPRWPHVDSFVQPKIDDPWSLDIDITGAVNEYSKFNYVMEFTK